ncbi:GNAT family N-acetyltransferase [Melissococcus plutonius]|uniref:N-acetyltransferase ElaA n=1 Tax=Melissococcus plutonius TaxID=33970 RepID=A0A2Z5Y0C6_9ENTE|nr:GNAT family N-acetyltransferase [Melissococcus plutonius]BAL61412.1 GCN5-related N-acetyltransferase [Melissococcus plutonius DAT561]MCV2498812.1 GNAT family N-acetyltransferase [Melissococcus plutonius]MCV2501048.1 GNAT family N-acetyltransferase [Melissococcus plutonius]MCV2504910.1 GNAT family N-acetyltransferase [Melissococcus plutonius]MCV2507428.1 GNAT family N-acetyltransferase [Melissococcus plutonius]
MNYYTKQLKELTSEQFYRIAQLRISVFVVEQNCPYQEIDTLDEIAWHIWLEDEKDNIVGYTRVINYEDYASFGRVLIAPTYRNSGLGKSLVAHTISFINEKYPNQPIVISGQAYLKMFYESFGFQAISDRYLEDNIPHIKMRKSI